ncbi:hypothetical protein O3M35_008367 [Rhynocoris fuscipes]|uniref:Ig-like domain-containing protein n=1 Tax=Rhynocoris fuscipes TaxID=488301 RepID=A0AAW1D613_9HEMI
MWNPNVSTALILNIYPYKEEYSYQLIFGDDENEHIKLNYITNSGEQILLKQKTHAHFLSSGRWVGIIIIMQDTQLKIYYEDTPNPFFTWSKGKSEHFSPINALYFSYEAKSKHDEGSIGLNFPCDICQTEICINERNLYSVYYPMNLWKENSPIKVKNISFNIRGNGTFIVNLYVIPAKYPIGVLSIEGTRVELQYTRKRFIDRVARKNTESPVIVNEHWTELILTIDDEKNGTLLLNGNSFMTWKYPRTPLVYFFGIKCTGKVTWVANCKPPKLEGKPTNGGWSSWSPWECSVTCGGGQGVRRRTCDHPEPTLLGKVCVGESVEKGGCNENSCGDVTMETINSVRKYLAQKANNIQIDSGDSAELKCNPTLLEVIKKQSPKSKLYWSKNGVKIVNEEVIENIDTNDFKLEITNAKTSKNGVYACIIVKLDEQQEIVDVIALIVKSKSYTITGRTGQPLKLKANTVLLNSVYSDLRLTWFINGQVYKEYDETDLRLIEEELISPLKRTHEGEWISVVYQDNLALNWTTSWYKVKVKKKANWATHLLEEDLFKGALGDNEIIIYIIVTFLFVIVIAAAAAITIFLIRLQKYFKNLKENQPNLDSTS